jgi:hypothetical protein
MHGMHVVEIGIGQDHGPGRPAVVVDRFNSTTPPESVVGSDHEDPHIDTGPGVARIPVHMLVVAEAVHPGDIQAAGMVRDVKKDPHVRPGHVQPLVVHDDIVIHPVKVVVDIAVFAMGMDMRHDRLLDHNHLWGRRSLHHHMRTVIVMTVVTMMNTVRDITAAGYDQKRGQYTKSSNAVQFHDSTPYTVSISLP